MPRAREPTRRVDGPTAHETASGKSAILCPARGGDVGRAGNTVAAGARGAGQSQLGQ